MLASTSSTPLSAMTARAARALRNNPLAAVFDESVKTPNWQRLVSANLLTKEEKEVLTQYEHQPPESVQELLNTEKNGKQYAHALLHCLDKVTDPLVSAYVLELISEFLVGDFAGRLPYFSFHFTGLIRLLESDNAYVRDKACALLALFLSLETPDEHVTNAFFTWCVEQLRASQTLNVQTAFFALSIALQNHVTRPVFIRHGGMKFLSSYLNLAATKNVLTTQIVYEICFVCWLLSMTQPSLFGFNECADLVQLLSDNRKEKINRAILATLVNVKEEPMAGEWFVQFELESKIKLLQTVRTQDPEMIANWDELLKFMQTCSKNVSSFSMYQQELASGKMKNNKITHSERFWKENVKHFAENDFATLKKLIAIIQDSADNMTLQVALSDLGFFSQYFPNGKAMLNLLGAKSAVMGLLEHPNRGVQKAALGCVSKLLVEKWDMIGA